jgi:hypothetical protein
MEPSEKVIEKIESGKFKNLKPKKKVEPSAKNGLTEAVKEEIKEIVKASNTEINNGKAPDAPEVEKKAEVEKKVEEKAPPEPVKPAAAAFPIKTTINAYGFIGLSKSELRALCLTVIDTKGEKKKLAAEVPITICDYNPDTKTLTIKIL